MHLAIFHTHTILPSAEICVTARPPRLETLETVEAPQLPGRMALRQQAQLAALPTRSLGGRAFPNGKDPFYSRQGLQQFLQLFGDVYRYTAHSPRPAPLAEVYSSTAVYSRSTVYSSTAVYSIQRYTFPLRCSVEVKSCFFTPQQLINHLGKNEKLSGFGTGRCAPLQVR